MVPVCNILTTSTVAVCDLYFKVTGVQYVFKPLHYCIVTGERHLFLKKSDIFYSISDPHAERQNRSRTVGDPHVDSLLCLQFYAPDLWVC